MSEEDRARIKSFVGDSEEDEEDDVEYVPAKKSRPSEEYFEPVRRNYGQPPQERFQRNHDQHLSHHQHHHDKHHLHKHDHTD